MTNTARWAFALALLPLAACNVNRSDPFAATVPQPMPTAITASAQDQNFVQAAQASDQFELQSSQLALQRSRSRAVRAYAQQMIDEHGMSSQTLTGLAGSKGMAPGTLDNTQQKMMATLQSAGSGFDREYLRSQVAGHAATVAAFRDEISGGYDTDVKGFAQTNLPTVQTHLDDARRLAGR